MKKVLAALLMLAMLLSMLPTSVFADDGIYTITYHLDGGSNALKNPDVYTGEDKIVLKDATKDGYNFLGWYLDEAKTKLISQIVNLEGDLDLYALFTPQKYESTFDFQGGTCTDRIKITLDDTLGTTKQFYIDNNSSFNPYQQWKLPKREGYVFAGWEYNGSVVKDVISTNTDVELKAVWNPINKSYCATILGVDRSSIYNNGAYFNGTMGDANYSSTLDAQGYIYSTYYVYVSGEYQTVNYSGYSFCNRYVERYPNDSSMNRSYYTYGGFTIYNATTRQTLVRANGWDDCYDQWDDSYNNRKDYSGTLLVAPGTLLEITVNGITNSPQYAGLYGNILKAPMGYIHLSKGEQRSPTNVSYSNTRLLSQEYDKTTQMPTIIKNGYTFDNWYDENDSPLTDVWHYLDNKTFVARWNPINYQISYELNGGKNNNNPSSYTIEDKIILTNPKKDGYTFNGWYSDSNFTTRVTGISNRTGDIKLYAKFTANQYTLTLDGNSGILAPKVTFVSNGKVIKEEYLSNSNEIVAFRPDDKDGYLFAGWYENADLTSLFKFSGTIREDTQLYAKWVSCNEKKLSVENETSFSVYVEGKTEQLYTFIPLADGEICVTSTSDCLDVCGALYDSNMETLISSNDISDNNLNFSYTYTVEAGKRYYIGVQGETILTEGNLNVSIDWGGNCSIVGTSYNTRTFLINYDASYSLPQAIREGYVFLGWFDETNTEITSGTWNFIRNKTLTAKWTTVHTVVFKDASGQILSSQTYYYGDNITAPELPEKVADNVYTYTASWDNNYSGICVGDATYTVAYTPTYINYTVTFKDWDDTLLSLNTYHYGDAIEPPMAPTREADDYYVYTFVGWDKEITKCYGDTEYKALFNTEHYHVYDNACDADCNTCGSTRTITHNYKWVIDQENNCGLDGIKHEECTVCHITKNVGTSIAATGNHIYNNDCDKSCNVCGTTRTITHDYADETCTAPKTCTVCGVTEGEKLGHTYSNACDKSCNRCKATRTVAGHDYEKKVTKATTTKDGKIKHVCSECGYTASKVTTIYKASKISLSTTTYTYTGGTKKPSVTVKDSKGKTISTSHYTVTYASGCKNVGTYKVTVKFKGNYSGTKTLTFKIIPAKTTLGTLTAAKKALTVKWTKKSTQVTGYQIQYSTSKSFKSYKTKTVSSYKTTSTKLTGLSAKKTYYVRVRTYKTVNGTKYYSGWSTIKYKKTK